MRHRIYTDLILSLRRATKSDKFDRYLVDVWVYKNKKEEYVNQSLVSGGHAWLT